jgi:hypothetical protein
VPSRIWGAALGKTDLQKNAFVVLGLAVSAKHEEVREAFEDLTAEHPEDESRLAEAKQALLAPKQRLSAEIAYLVDTPLGEAVRVLRAVLETTDQLSLRQAASRLAPLSRSNVIVHLVQTSRLIDADLIVDVVIAHAQFDTTLVVQAINRARTEAQIVGADVQLASDEISKHINRQRTALFDVKCTPRLLADTVNAATRRLLHMKDPAILDALGGVLEAYWRSIGSTTASLRSDLVRLSDSIVANPTDSAALEGFLTQLREWDYLAQPLQLVELEKGRDDPEATEIFRLVRKLCLALANDVNQAAAALRITRAAREIFAELPRASEKITEDILGLESLVVEQACGGLVKVLERIKSESTQILTAVWPSLAVSIIDQLKFTLAKLNEATDLPWLIMRSISITLFNDKELPQAALDITKQTIVLAEKASAPIEMINRLKRDLSDIEISLLEKELTTHITEKRWSKASVVVDAIIAKHPDPKAVSEFKDVKSKIDAKVNARAFKWLAAAACALFFIFNVISDQNKTASYTRQPAYVPPSSTASTARTSPSYQPVPLPQERQPTPAAPGNQQRTVAALSDYAEVRPAVGSDGQPPPAFSRENIRYCMFEKARLSHLRELQRRDEGVARFNAAVDDFNSVCGQYRYRPSDQASVELEIASRDQILRSQAAERLRRWRTIDQSAAPGTPSGAAFGTTSPTASIQKPEAALTPLLIVPVAIDLLSIDDAMRVQRRLSELGYLKDAANGTWGPGSRAAMRVFKVTNGLGDDDRVDAASAGALLSQSAKVAQEGLASISQSTEMVAYAGPMGARLNPINPADASKINAKLRERGFYKGKNDALWSGASRLALREFKKVAGIAGDDGWDPITELALLSDSTPTPTPLNPDIEFEASVGGVWAVSASHCPPSRGTNPPIVISRERATAGEQACQFLEKRGGGQQWDVRALCRGNGASWTANIRLARDGATLGWSSERGSVVYHRCTR